MLKPRPTSKTKQEETPDTPYTGRPIRLEEIQSNEYLMKNGI